MKTILVIDTGSSSIKGILYDLNGQIITKHSIGYQMNIQNNYFATMDSQIFRNALDQILGVMSKYIMQINVELSAIALTSQRSSVLPINSDGEPLSPIIMWYDKRSTDICNKICSISEDALYDICGMKLSPLCSAPKMAWLKKERPQIYHDSHKLVGIHDYLLYLLTKQFATDSSCASRTCLMDIRSLEWSDELINLFDLNREKLCDIYAPGSIIGVLDTEVADSYGLSNKIPVISAGGDQQCSLLGQGVSQPGDLGITCGTGSYITTPIDTPRLDLSSGLNLNASCIKNMWVLEATVLASGSVYDWFNNNFYPDHSPIERYSLINRDISKVPVGADGVLCFSNLFGKGSPLWDSYARGSFHNIGLDTTRAHMARAMLEGICYEIYDCFCALKSITGPITKVMLSGGLSKFECFNQILADMTDHSIEVTHQAETTALGAFITACATLGIEFDYKNTHEVDASQKNSTIYHPNSSATETYLNQYRIREHLISGIDSKLLSSINYK